MKENFNQRLKSAGIVFLLILFVLLVFKITREGIFTKKSGLNIAVVGDSSMGVLILRPGEDFLGWVDIPSKLKVKIFNSSAEYPAVSLWEYGVIEKKPFEVVEKSLGLSMGVAIARTIKVQNNADLEDVLGSLHKLALKTDLSLRDRFLIRQYIAEAVASKKVLEMDIPKNTMDQITEPDGKDFLEFNSVVQLWTKNKFVLESILNENVEVSINNLSGVSGLGISLSRQMETAGVRVTEVKSDDTDDISGNGCIFVTSGTYPNTELFLQQQIGCSKKTTEKGIREKGIAVYLKP